VGTWRERDCFGWSSFGVFETMERYEILKDIGSGNFGVAKLIKDKLTRELFAVKFIERGQKVCFFSLTFSFLLFVTFFF
jgi:hypothetical protein